jgi:hypothetical protein
MAREFQRLPEPGEPFLRPRTRGGDRRGLSGGGSAHRRRGKPLGRARGRIEDNRVGHHRFIPSSQERGSPLTRRAYAPVGTCALTQVSVGDRPRAEDRSATPRANLRQSTRSARMLPERIGWSARPDALAAASLDERGAGPRDCGCVRSRPTLGPARVPARRDPDRPARPIMRRSSSTPRCPSGRARAETGGAGRDLRSNRAGEGAWRTGGLRRSAGAMRRDPGARATWHLGGEGRWQVLWRLPPEGTCPCGGRSGGAVQRMSSGPAGPNARDLTIRATQGEGGPSGSEAASLTARAPRPSDKGRSSGHKKNDATWPARTKSCDAPTNRRNDQARS